MLCFCLDGVVCLIWASVLESAEVKLCAFHNCYEVSNADHINNDQCAMSNQAVSVIVSALHHQIDISNYEKGVRPEDRKYRKLYWKFPLR